MFDLLVGNFNQINNNQADKISRMLPDILFLQDISTLNIKLFKSNLSFNVVECQGGAILYNRLRFQEIEVYPLAFPLVDLKESTTGKTVRVALARLAQDNSQLHVNIERKPADLTIISGEEEFFRLRKGYASDEKAKIVVKGATAMTSMESQIEEFPPLTLLEVADQEVKEGWFGCITRYAKKIIESIVMKILCRFILKLVCGI